MQRLVCSRPAAVALRMASLSLAVALSAAVPRAQSNILLVIADDLGVDRVGAYGEHPDPGRTPVLDQLAADGLLFRNTWSNPFCSPTRATLLTGRHALDTGIGTFLGPAGPVELGLDEDSIPRLLPATYRHAAVGKWHLSGAANGALHPLLLGFEHHRGAMSNFVPTSGETYFDWEKSVDGVPERSTTYATTDTVDDALALIDDFAGAPWFLWLAFNAPHKPLHHPPAALHGYDLPAAVEDDPPLFMKAMTEAMDTELGRLLAGIDPVVLADTVVIFVGDNGTAGDAVTAPFDPTRAKGTVYEGGVNVPLIVKGPGVTVGGECSGLVHTSDVFATVLELAGAASPAPDSVSLVPYFADPQLPSLRPWVHADRFTPNASVLLKVWHRAVRDERFKLVQRYTQLQLVHEELFDLDHDPFELVDLLDAPLVPEAQAGLAALHAVLAQLPFPAWQGPWADLGAGHGGVGGLPHLQGSGSLLAGDPFRIDLDGAAPDALAGLVLGIDWLAVPFKGGSLIPTPDVVVALVSDSQGAISFGGAWPTGLPGGVPLYLQHWIADPSTPTGYAASNALGLLAP